MNSLRDWVFMESILPESDRRLKPVGPDGPLNYDYDYDDWENPVSCPQEIWYS